MSDATIKNGGKELSESNWLEIVRRQVGLLQYGVVEIIVHDSRVTQIEKTERVRLDNRALTTTQTRQSAAPVTIINT